MGDHVEYEMQDLIGSWSGNSRLWLSPDQDPRICHSTAEITSICKGQFLHMAYTWEADGRPQDGLIIFGARESAGTSLWLDSWHMARQIMVCESVQHDNVVSLTGTYAAPRGPDWGWRIEIESAGNDGCVVRMFNIWPDGREDRAVLVEYSRSD